MMRNYNFTIDRLGGKKKREMPLPELNDAFNLARNILHDDQFASSVKIDWEGCENKVTIERQGK